MNVVVIGAGFGGLAAAIRLRALGHDVTVVEKRDRPGGRAYVFRQDGFTFDAGPTIITAPQFIDELFAVSGRARSDYVTLVPLRPFYRISFDDGASIDVSGDGAMARQVAGLSPADVGGYRRFSAAAADIFDRAMPLIDRPMESLGSMLRVTPQLVRTRAWRSVAWLAERHFRDARLRAAFSFHPLLIGGHPFDTPAIYALIPELERRWGVWYAMGGTGALVRALEQLLVDCGATVRCGHPVESILVHPASGRVAGVRLGNGESIAADIVVSNADPVWTVRHLLPARLRGTLSRLRLARVRHGMSVFVLYFGTDRQYSDRLHHEIIMGPRYRPQLDDIFHHHRLADDFSIYLHRPSATDPTVAPAGCDAWYALVPVPNLRAHLDWSSAGPALRDRIVRYLEQRGLPGLSRHIVSEHHVDPTYFRDELNSPLGSAFSLEPRLMQSAWFRPHHVSSEVQGLYFVGAGTHPGAGIPGVLASAKIVATLVGGAPLRDSSNPSHAALAGATAA